MFPAGDVREPRNMTEIAGPAHLDDVRVEAHSEVATITIDVGGEAATLSAIVPMLECLGFEVLDEQTTEPTPHHWRHVLRARHASLAAFAHQNVCESVATAIRSAWGRPGGGDNLQQLTITAGLDQRQIDILRSYTRYLNQIGSVFTQATLIETLARHPDVAAILSRLFAARFDPSISDGIGPDRVAAMSKANDELATALDAVASLDDDRVLRRYGALIQATVRTNAYRTDRFGSAEAPIERPGSAAIAFKFDPSRVPDLPAPKPKHEVWVAGPSVEGVHLRGGDVARGGLRWSDRADDFRTEVLGLMKAQMVKNAIIVPVGAKGGFVSRAATPGATADGPAAYRTFIGALLDVTDNLVGGQAVPPPDVVRHDGDDTYLVVAADKGTARFSDTANEVAASYGFWLGDAFASGGSKGYDHKAMGITAKGAWESVRRHFRMLGVDADTARLTVVGIGDMSGDVFGNGMLLSGSMQLVAAFDHRHIFLDPEPDPTVSFGERRRLFDLPKSSWHDYDPTKLSAGGGVHLRTAKAIPITTQVKARLGIEADSLTPAELMQAIMRAPVDLFWNGGIGTYVKATTEDHDEVDDRTNDALRVNGNELRCKVVGEGGNLGFTQLGRIEFAAGGGFINTDAVDNSAGVDTSDHEVNIKIALAAAERDGSLSPAEREAFLESMTNEIATDVLADNHHQNVALAIARVRAVPMMDVHARYLRALEFEKLIDRQLEFLPTEKQFAERRAAGNGLTTPEFAVLLAYTKNANIAELLRSDLPDDPYLRPELVDYFPLAMQPRFGAQIASHALRREIVTTAIVNEMVNKSGITFDHRLLEETGAALVDTTRAWIVARDVLDVKRWWREIDALPPTVSAEAQLDLFLSLRQATERATTWLVGHRRPPLDIAATVGEFARGVGDLAIRIDEWSGGAVGRDLRIQAAEIRKLGVPAPLARVAANWNRLNAAFDIVELAVEHRRSVPDATRAYFSMFERLDLDWLWQRIGGLNRVERWANQARSAIRDDLLVALRRLADTVLGEGDAYDAPEILVTAWARSNAPAIQRSQRVFSEIRAGGVFDVTTLTVAVRQLHNLATACQPGE